MKIKIEGQMYTSIQFLKREGLFHLNHQEKYPFSPGDKIRLTKRGSLVDDMHRVSH